MEIRGPGGVGGPGEIRPRQPVQGPAPKETQPPVRTDRVEISEVARLKGLLASVPPIRAERVAELKKEIQAGRFLTAERLSQAIDNLIKEELG